MQGPLPGVRLLRHRLRVQREHRAHGRCQLRKSPSLACSEVCAVPAADWALRCDNPAFGGVNVQNAKSADLPKP